MIQTHLLKLEPPYQIIACKGEIGVQIATLIVTEETRGENGEYGITTHSHPVVSYVEKPTISKRISDSGDDNDGEIDALVVHNGEGVVWDKVECYQTTLVSLTDQKDRKMSCMDFCILAAPMLEETAFGGKWRGHQIAQFLSKVDDMGFTIINDEERECEITLNVSKGYYVHHDGKMVIDGMDMTYPMPVPIMDPKEMLGWYRRIVRQYNIIFGEDLTFHFRSLYEPPYKEDFLDEDFDPENLTPEQKICNEIADLLRHTNLNPTRRNG